MNKTDTDLELDNNKIVEVDLGKRRATAAWGRASAPWSR